MESVPPSLDFDRPPAEPVAQLQLWLDEAAAKTGLPNPNAFALATIGADGRPSARIVLLKGLDERGAVFHTNYQSRKGAELAGNDRAAALFHWDPLNRQIRIEGRVTRLTPAESDAYFATRPRDSQIGAWASRQSQPVKDRAALEAAVAEVEGRYAGRAVPRPPHWGGYRISLDSIEFWQGHRDRVHDRIVYASDGRGGWKIQRLFP